MDFMGDTERPFSIATSWYHALVTPLRLCVRLARLKWASLFGEAACLYEGLGQMVGPSADQLEWARWEVLEYFREGVIECTEDMTVLDVGAHIGFFAREVMSRTRNTARLYCLEPLPRTCGFLRRNTQHFDATSAPRVFNCGAGRAHGHVVMQENPVLSTSSYCNGGAGPFRLSASAAAAALFEGDTDIGSLHFTRRLRGVPFVSVLRCIARRLYSAIQVANGRAQLHCGPEYLCEIRPLSSIIDSADIRRIDVLKIDVEGAELVRARLAVPLIRSSTDVPRPAVVVPGRAAGHRARPLGEDPVGRHRGARPRAARRAGRGAAPQARHLTHQARRWLQGVWRARPGRGARRSRVTPDATGSTSQKSSPERLTDDLVRSRV